jgi:nucleoside-triphosphatase
MSSHKKNILITGIPGVGKTTLVKKILDEQKHLNAVGFYTAEIREAGIRKGFELVGLDGQRRVLSHVRIKGPYRVGRYGVDIIGFDEFLDSMNFLDVRADLFVIDEIGKMECFSEKFRSLMRKILDSDTRVIATIAQKGGGIIAETKSRTDSQLFDLTFENRDRLAFVIARAVAV